MKGAPSFICANAAASMKPVVSGVTRACSDTTSDCASKAARPTCATPAARSAASKGPQQLGDTAADMAVADQAHALVAQFFAGAVGAVQVAAPLAAHQRHM